MKKVILTGGTGFLGNWLLKELVKNGVFVYVVCRKNSRRASFLRGMPNTSIISMNMDEITGLPNVLEDQCDAFYHLAWEGGRNDVDMQMRNILPVIRSIEAAKILGCKKFICTGSQAEYGIHTQRITEDTTANPVTAYGASKLAAYHMSSVKAKQTGIELVWVRVFSVFGPGDNPNTLISTIIEKSLDNTVPEFTEAAQPWNFLYVEDAVEALRLLGQADKVNGIYNLAHNESRRLRNYISEAVHMVLPQTDLKFGNYCSPLDTVSLDVSVDKLMNEISWKPKTNFNEGMRKTIQMFRKEEV